MFIVPRIQQIKLAFLSNSNPFLFQITIPKLYYQLLMENSQHSMLHERYVYTKRLAIQKMKTSEQALWKRLTIDMKLRLESNSGIDIADAIFTIFYWIYHRQT
jgi:hypothetical protein